MVDCVWNVVQVLCHRISRELRWTTSLECTWRRREKQAQWPQTSQLHRPRQRPHLKPAAGPSMPTHPICSSEDFYFSAVTVSHCQLVCRKLLVTLHCAPQSVPFATFCNTLLMTGSCSSHRANNNSHKLINCNIRLVVLWCKAIINYWFKLNTKHLKTDLRVYQADRYGRKLLWFIVIILLLCEQRMENLIDVESA